MNRKNRMRRIYLLLISDKFSFWFNYLLIISSLVLLRLPIALGYRYDLPHRFLGLLPLICVTIYNSFLIRKKKIPIHINVKVLLGFLVFFFIWTIALVRTGLSAINFDTLYFFKMSITYIVLCVQFATALLLSSRQIERSRLLKGILYAFVVYIFANLILYLLGINLAEKIYLSRYPTQLLSLLGVHSYRILFPMADGINSFGLLSGATFAGVVVLGVKDKQTHVRILSVIMAVICLTAVLMTDSRGALMFSILAISISLMPRIINKYLRWSAFLVSVIPVILFGIYPGSVFEGLSWTNRPEGEKIELPNTVENASCLGSEGQADTPLSNRPLVWKIILEDLKSPKFEHFFGYGFRGHVVSELSSKYQCLFSSYALSNLASSHNIWLQIILDIGYIGLIVTIFMVCLIIYKLGKNIDHSSVSINLGYSAVMVYIILIGSMETSISPDYYGTFIWLLFIAVSTIVVSPQKTTSIL